MYLHETLAHKILSLIDDTIKTDCSLGTVDLYEKRMTWIYLPVYIHFIGDKWCLSPKQKLPDHFHIEVFLY